MTSAQTSGSSTPPAAGGNSNNNSGGRNRGGRNNGSGNNAQNKPKRNQFVGLAGSDTAIYGKTVTTGPNQATQIIDLVDALITYSGAQGYGRWAESISELKRLTKRDFVGTPPQKAKYGKVTINGAFAFSTLGEEEYKIDYDIWKAEFGITLKDHKQYEKEADYLFLAIKGQFEPIAWDDLEHNSRFGPICLSRCPIELINLLMETCSTNESSTWDPLARIRHLRKSITYMQKPKSAPTAVDTAQYKRYLAVYVSNAFRAGGDFVFGTNFYKPFLANDSKSLIDYLTMDLKDKKYYDKKVQDLIVSVLMIEGCKSKPLRDHLKNQFLTGNVDCYPQLSSKAFEMIDNFASDETNAPNPNKNRNRGGGKNQQHQKQDDAVAGAHVHQDEEAANDVEEPASDTRALVLAAVADNGIIHRNAFEPISSRDEFEEEDMGEVACIIIGDHYYPGDSSDDDEAMPGLSERAFKDESSSDDETVNSEDDPLNIVLVDGQDDSSYETNQSMDFDDEFSYDDSIQPNELSSASSHLSSSSSECTTEANGDFQSVICEASYVCGSSCDDSSAATFTSHDDTVIDNIDDLKVLLDSGATVNITSTRLNLKMEQSVVRYLDDVTLGVPRSLSINGRPSSNIAHMIDVRQRFGGSIEIVRREDLYLGGSTTKFTLYKLAPYFNRAGVPGGPDKLDNLRDVMTLDIPGAYLYYDPTDAEFQPIRYSNFKSEDFY